MRPSARPTSRSDFRTWSLSNSVMPVRSTAADRRPLIDDHDQHVAIDFEAHVLEQAAGVQRADRLRATLRIEPIADPNRQIGEDSSGLGALHAFDADVAHDEFLRRSRYAPGGDDGRCKLAQNRAQSADMLRLDATRRFNGLFPV